MNRATYVLFPMGEQRFALHTEVIAEFIRLHRLYVFPHTTPLVEGVLVRRGRVVPVLDVSPVLVGTQTPERRFYLIVRRKIGGVEEWTAIPVPGECELVNAEEQPRSEKLPSYITGLLSLPRPQGQEREAIAVVDLNELLRTGMAQVRA